MNEKNIENIKGKQTYDTFAWPSVWLIVILGVYGNYHFSGYSLFIRIASITALTIAAGFIAYYTKKGKFIADLVISAKNEIYKVVWPSRAEVMQTTIVVIVAVIIVGALLWGIDSSLGWSIKKMIR